MLQSLQKLYQSAEEVYLEIEDTILDYAEEAYGSTKEYIDEVSDEISDYLNNYFKNNDIHSNDPILIQLSKLTKTLSSLDENNNDDWDSKLIYIATSLGHMNEKITTVLYDYYNSDIYTKNTQSVKINSLKSHLSKTIINDLHFINTFRNSILHHNDYGHDLLNLDLVTKKKLQNEAQAALAKLEYVYIQLKDIKIQQISNAKKDEI